MMTATKTALPTESVTPKGLLSRQNTALASFAEDHPEYSSRRAFEALPDIEERLGYPVQAWPTFVRKDELRRLAQLNVDLCRLTKRAPYKVFGADVGKIRDFYALQPEHAQIVAPILGQESIVGRTLARTDLFPTEQGFRCLEVNVASNLGGWETSYWADAYLRDPLIARFVSEQHLDPKCTDVLRALLTHLLGQALRSYKSTEINIGLLTPHGELDDAVWRFIRAAGELYDRLLSALGQLRGKLVHCRPDDLAEKRGLLHAGGTRLHAVLDIGAGRMGLDAYRCWMRGTVQLYNGPLAPVLSDKRNLALLSELADSDLWTTAEKDVIRAAVPWTRRVSEQSVHPDAAELVTRDSLRANRTELVLKPSNQYAGRDVYLGVNTSADEWDSVIDRAFDEGHWIVQERLEAAPLVLQAGDHGRAAHDVVWSFFVFGESFGGYFLRMTPTSQEDLVNTACGAIDGWLFEVED